jgi:sterol desaturase/sphingolipid hydroxylase (fatty acid hydroxylase superfamily)
LKGANFGISLSIWDYIFNTNYIPDEVDSNEELGFEKDEEFPQRFFGQFLSGWK